MIKIYESLTIAGSSVATLYDQNQDIVYACSQLH